MKEKEDARLLPMDALHERHSQMVRLHGKGMGMMRIIEMTFQSYPAVGSAIDRYKSGEIAAIKLGAVTHLIDHAQSQCGNRFIQTARVAVSFDASTAVHLVKDVLHTLERWGIANANFSNPASEGIQFKLPPGLDAR